MYILPLLLHSIRSKSQASPTLKKGRGGVCKYVIPRRWGSWGHPKICHFQFLFHHFCSPLFLDLYYPPTSPHPTPQPKIKKKQNDLWSFFLVVGLKLNSVDPAMSIDLKYLGVQLPLAPATSFPFWNLTGTNPASPGECVAFVKSNKFVIKIKCYHCYRHIGYSNVDLLSSDES